MYLFYISESTNEEIWIASTEIIFDLLLKYGFEHFDITQDDDMHNGSKRSRSIRLYSHNDDDTNVNDKISPVDSSNDVIKVLMALLDSQVNNLLLK